MRRVTIIGVIAVALLIGGGCRPSTQDRLEGEKLFIPLLGFAQAYLRIDLDNQTRPGGVLIKYLDFSGKRVALEVIPLPSHKNGWAVVLGGRSEKNGLRYYGIKVERFGESDAPLNYHFQPIAGSEKKPLGLFD